MKLFVALAALLCLCDARPSFHENVTPTAFENVDSYIIGGSNAAPGAWPWQLSQQRLGGSWSHSCGASILKTRYALSAAHCVDGASVGSLRVIAGLHDRTNMAGTQTANLGGYKMHEQYNNGAASYANDIAILTFSTLLNFGGNVQPATLPPNNNNNYAGSTCIITGWGRTSSSNTLPNVLQQATIGILTTAACQSATGSGVWANHICIKDSANTRGACNGDSGGPCNCGNVVTGIASFVYQSGGNCLPSYPSVYTRVSAYLAWITTNTP
jgi:secreted trypsin-like serine protease